MKYKFKLFPHQKEALSKITNFYKDTNRPYSGLVIIPTGGGKTFTAVRWIHDEMTKRPVKIIWLAQSFELLNQAFESFKFDENNMNNHYNMRIISSNSLHSSVKEISDIDDILIITTQTAIHAFKQESNNLTHFVENNKENGLIVVLDEAHHSPAYGCRKLLLRLKQDIENLWLLGLTATPTYTNVERRGWLWEIFDGGIIYKVEKRLLQQQHILAKENIIKKKTPIKIEVSDEVFNQLTHQHKDIPEHIIEQIASNRERSNFIINDYIKNIDFYGKTIIFLDRWFQCLYVKDKLIENGVKADAIFYQNDTDKQVRADAKQSNKQIINDFKNDKIKVLLNVRMLTEGADIPDVNTVFITRDTTSHILLQQMIGRALRGEKAGGKKDIANIVLFGDNWDKTIAWAEPETHGGIDDSRIKQITVPTEKISLHLMEQLVKSITFNSVSVPEFLDLIPIGWYQNEYVSYYGNEESIEIIRDIVLVYQQTQPLLETFIEQSIGNLDENWALEDINTRYIQHETQKIISEYFLDLDNIFIKELRNGISSICRHIAQNNSKPEFFMFANRDEYDLEQLAKQLINLPPLAQYNLLSNEYNNPGSIWPHFYPQFFYFKSSVDMYINKLLFNITSSQHIPETSHPQMQASEFTSNKEQLKAVKMRDNNACLCCGLTSKETKLETDYILPLQLVRQSTINNLQTLCSKCKRQNSTQSINYSQHRTSLLYPNKFIGVEFELKYIKNIIRIKAGIKASINMFFECGSVYDILLSRRKNSPFYRTWIIVIYSGNQISWLEKIKPELLFYIKTQLHQDHVSDISFRSIK